MGKVGVEAIGVGALPVTEVLNRAAAAELQEAFRYKLLTSIAEGLYTGRLATWFDNASQQGWNYTSVWMSRIVSIGGRPFNSLDETSSNSFVPYQHPPEGHTDLRKMMEHSLESTRTATKFFGDIVLALAEVDLVNSNLAREALSDQVRREGDL